MTASRRGDLPSEVAGAKDDSGCHRSPGFGSISGGTMGYYASRNQGFGHEDGAPGWGLKREAVIAELGRLVLS